MSRLQSLAQMSLYLRDCRPRALVQTTEGELQRWYGVGAETARTALAEAKRVRAGEIGA